MGWLPTSILPREACFAYVASAFRLAEIYVPFVDVSDAPKSVTRTQRGVSDRSAQGYAQAAHAASSPVRLALGHIASPDFSAVVQTSFRIVAKPPVFVDNPF